jgi:hypothetical protein
MVDNSSLVGTDSGDLRGLVERIRRGDCVLVLGPRVAIGSDDAGGRPLDERLALELTKDLDGASAATASAAISAATATPVNLRRAADLYYRACQDREALELTVQDFYKREAGSTTDFHRNLAGLPFRLCISATPDSLMLNAFKEARKSPEQGHYSFKQPTAVKLSTPVPARPLVYHLFGHHEDSRSLVLTEGDLIEFLVNIIRGAPPIPDEVRHIFNDPNASFLFLGFGFQNWYLRVLLEVLKVYGHRSKAIAFEDATFFQNPDRQEVIGFFSGDRRIDFRPLRWALFAQQLRAAYDAVMPSQLGAAAPVDAPLPADAPRAFISYANEDRDTVEKLTNELRTRGIAVWRDKDDLRAGDDWDRVLLNVIATRVDYVIVVQTPAMVARVQGVFNREIEAAQKRQSEMGEYQGQRLRFLLPVKMGESPLLSSLEAAHVIDVSAPEGLEALRVAIVEDWARRATLKKQAA